MSIIRKIKAFFSAKEENLSAKLAQIGYFDLITNKEKLQFIKEKINSNYLNAENDYSEGGWLIIPNDYYVSSQLNIYEYSSNSSTSDFRGFEVWGEDLYEQNLESYLQSAKTVFETHGLLLNWENERFEDITGIEIHHIITINSEEYIVFSGDPTYEIILQYIKSLATILNDVIKKQNKELEIITVTQHEAYCYFILADPTMKSHLHNILKKTNNQII
ncbi:hypothetical protein VSP20_03525 [Myroides phaeus]|uniref:hypothetical protein n=1 Tax=Myroides phaeus TaxID=702745 RepID=UPI002DBDEA58|nr:hypothetical protein [Myroides phaeus]MEC4116033.1 hypothetical protein [Myroides phaeus]